ncbi:MAG: NAD(P)-binding domain-containing protein [Actinomycetota bacterium]|nr:NAD(P)-binding domain-containing protein [Actinomycetota bacterium]
MNLQPQISTLSADTRIAVLGQGRMGTAIANKIAGLGYEVTRWNRGGSLNSDSKARLATALTGASVVVMSLYDGKACVEVSELVQPNLGPNALVVNTSTIATSEAKLLDSFFTANKVIYVQAPVMGSVPAIDNGIATVILGGTPTAIDRARPIIATFSQAHIEFASAEEAAGAKLMSNHALAEALLAIRQALVVSGQLGLPMDRVLDVLELGPLAPMVKGKRARLESEREFSTADATLAGLIKDLELAADVSPAAAAANLKLQELVRELKIDPNADIAELPRSAIP